MRRKSCTGQGWVYISVYVDDNLAFGPCEIELENIMKGILSKFLGKEVKPEISPDGVWQTWDILGVDVKYSQKLGALKMSMPIYINKLLDKFQMQHCEIVDAPSFDATRLEMDQHPQKNPEVDFPYREAVGALQWLSVQVRPDITFPVSILARHSSQKPTRARVTALKRVLRYLKGTLDLGLEYNKEIENKFL